MSLVGQAVTLARQAHATWRSQGPAALLAKVYRNLGMLVAGEAFYHRPIVNFIRQHSDSYPTFIDIGAHLGEITFAVADAFERCVVVEPVPKLAASIREALDAQRIESCAVVQVALAREARRQTLFLSQINSGDNSLAKLTDKTEEIEVECMTLDSLVDELQVSGPVLMKMDVQGLEFEICQSGASTLETQKCLVVSEFWPWGLSKAGHSPSEYLRWMNELEYRVLSLRGQPISRPQLERLCWQGAKDPLVVSDIAFAKS